MALLAKNRGMVSTCPIPMKRSRVLTRQATTREKVEKMAAPSSTASSTPGADGLSPTGVLPLVSPGGPAAMDWLTITTSKASALSRAAPIGNSAPWR